MRKGVISVLIRVFPFVSEAILYPHLLTKYLPSDLLLFHEASSGPPSRRQTSHTCLGPGMI